MPITLPLAGDAAPERADAARNREAVLASATRLVADLGVEAVSMDAVARAAGVGKGTLFRRFGSREGLMAAVLDRSESAWQAAVISGPPPLGPGAPAGDRLLAAGHARLRLNVTHGALIRAATGSRGERAAGAASFAVMHVRHLLAELGVAGDLPVLAAALLAPLDVVLIEQQHAAGVSTERIAAGWEDLVARVVGPAVSGGGAAART